MASVREIITDMAEQSESETVLLSEDLDAAIIGVQRKDEYVIAVYSESKILSVIQETMECNKEQAQEYFEFNIEYSFLGDTTPIYVDDSFIG